MCFKNLPVEFDETGKPYLKAGVRDPYSTSGGVAVAQGVQTLTDAQITDLLARNGHIKDVDFDPVTRVAGALAFHAVADLQQRRILTTNSMATLFRGYEVIMVGRDPLDAIFITSRACGVCGGVHATCAAQAMEMAFPVEPPPLGVVVRNMMLALEFLYDHPLHLFLLAGPDYSQLIVEATNPEVWERAQRTPAPHAAQHGYATIAALMEDMNPLTGKLYVEALHMTRVAREAYVLLGGKYPHPETIVPGGVSTTVSTSTMNEVYVRIAQFFDYGKKVAGIWEDITDFFYDVNPAYKLVGARPASMIDLGIWDDPDAYDATYANSNAWGERRWATPGALINGELVTTQLQSINLGFEEFVEHSYYDTWDGRRFATDPAGGPLSPYHPWNKETKPRPSGQNWKEKYSWSTSPRWDRTVVEAGAYARLYNTAAAQKLPFTRLLQSTGSSLKVSVPRATLPEMELEWKIPAQWNAFERNRARAYAVAYTTMVALDNWLMGQDLIKAGKTAVSSRFEVPKKGLQVGVGFWGAGRGWLAHHVVMEDGAIRNYQITTPSTINASPRDPWGNLGPYEEAVMNTPILENFNSAEEYKGIDILRTIRSFDPCMPCTTHIFAGDRVVTREVNTCACGVE